MKQKEKKKVSWINQIMYTTAIRPINFTFFPPVGLFFFIQYFRNSIYYYNIITFFKRYIFVRAHPPTVRLIPMHMLFIQMLLLVDCNFMKPIFWLCLLNSSFFFFFSDLWLLLCILHLSLSLAFSLYLTLLYQAASLHKIVSALCFRHF